ncbi:MAG: AAA family ATPase [Myxococcales bacterium]|nr:AAA family ATPase [Myxococcales bacterium]MCB9736699.1 AAA family ATPase [Deltaproteobacteria bacterium]
MTPKDRLTQLRVSGLRLVEGLELDLAGLTVLIGDNGTGKSTVLEALALLRSAAEPGDFGNAVLDRDHGPFRELLGRTGALELGVTVEGDGEPLRYDVRFELAGAACVLDRESLATVSASGVATAVLQHTRQELRLRDPATGALKGAPLVGPATLALGYAANSLSAHPELVRLSRALRGIEVQPPLDVRPLWQQREVQNRTGPRWPARPDTFERVQRYGTGLPSAFAVIRNERDRWQRLVDRARAAVGVDLDDIQLVPAGSGELDVVLKFRGGAARPLRVMSEGQVAYLGLLAMVELGQGRTLLALDEPDVHLHPELAVNLVQILEELGASCPVVVATHSDRLLDGLSDPAAEAVLCEVGSEGVAVMRRPNPATLDALLESHRGLGDLRAAGLGAHAFDDGRLLAAPPDGGDGP